MRVNTGSCKQVGGMFACDSLSFLAAGLIGAGDDHGAHARIQRALDYPLTIILKRSMRQVNANIYEVIPFGHFEWLSFLISMPMCGTGTKEGINWFKYSFRRVF